MESVEKMKKINNKKVFLAVFSVLFIAWGFLWQLPYFIESPGPIVNLNRFVTVENKEDNLPGSFNITTVTERPATPFLWAWAHFQEFDDITTRQETLGDATREEHIQMNRFFMQSSQNAAQLVALKLAGYESEPVFKGVHVMSISENSDFADRLSVGDILTQVDGRTFESSQEMIAYIRTLSVGDEVKIDFTHQGQKKTASGELIQLPNTDFPGIGITLVDNTQITSDIQISYNARGIGGPSGGVMLTLETYAQVTGRDIRQGKKIAGTGTMDFNGNVGRVGGVEKKVVSASREGVSIFFVPNDEISDEMRERGSVSNYEEAKRAGERINTQMKIVPVRTAQEALEYLESLK